MIERTDVEKFNNSIIAQSDDEDYDESGYVAVVDGNWAAIASYSHCSCYGTWASITGGGISDDIGPDDPRWDWEGTPKQLVELAKRKADPAMPKRKADPKDNDYDHLMAMYEQILEWGKKHRV